MNNINYKSVKKVLWIILFANFIVAFVKIIIGTMISSSSMTADGFHSLSDGSSNIVGLIGISIASKPVDENHPYGHKKFEILAGLVIAGLLLAVSFKIIIEAFLHFYNPSVPDITYISLIALLITLVINIFVCFYEYNKGKKLNSYLLISDSLHTKSDIYISIGVLTALIGIRLGLPPIIDPLISLVVAGFILYASYEIFISTSGILVDEAVLDSKKIKEIAMKFQQVKNVHKIRSRGCADDYHIDMHIMTDPNMSVEESHILIHDIEEKVNEEISGNIQVIVHIEPYYDIDKD